MSEKTVEYKRVLERTPQLHTAYERACYLLALYKGAIVVLDGGKTMKEITLAHLIESIVVGQEMVLAEWEKNQEIPYEAKAAEVIKQVGSSNHMIDVASFLSIMRKEVL